MKKIRKAAWSLTLMFVLLVSIAPTVFASGASITFQGFTSGFDFQPGSEYTETDLFHNFKDVMPGDVLSETITFKNSAADCDYVNLYMRAETHDETENSLSPEVSTHDETVATMSDFLSKLSMKVWNGTELIYEAAPNELGGLEENKLLGVFNTGETATLTVELTVPKELENKYANRVGEVDWVFHVEAYSKSQLSVRKIWSDGNSNHENESITVNLLKDGEVEHTATLSHENQWAYTFDNLAEDYTWSVEEASVPEGYTVSYNTVGTMTTITNTLIPLPEETVDVTVVKEWVNNGQAQPESVTIQLYKGDQLHDTVTLDDSGNWTHTWPDLLKSYSWSVREINIPDGYTASYSVDGDTTTITNTYMPTTPPDGTSLTVSKVWKDNKQSHPDSIKVDLLRNGKYYASKTLDSGNSWSYTWQELDAEYSWSVVESSIPEGYDVSYEVVGKKVTITNTQKTVPTQPIDLSVKKVWDDQQKNRPDSVTVTLYNGDTPFETVRLGAWNNWSHTWKDLSADGNWQVIEVNIPKGYTPSYAVKNGLVTITNTAVLAQTGQLNWPIPVLSGLGLILFTLGWIFIVKKKKTCLKR